MKSWWLVLMIMISGRCPQCQKKLSRIDSRRFPSRNFYNEVTLGEFFSGQIARKHGWKNHAIVAGRCSSKKGCDDTGNIVLCISLWSCQYSLFPWWDQYNFGWLKLGPHLWQILPYFRWWTPHWWYLYRCHTCPIQSQESSAVPIFSLIQN